ncbi:MAG TPA: NAD(P)/FAD-dependent oxidoreductase [Pseudomonadales bacterium]|nr:NAD(P)/FAD-dependent oxidoreductase [Pseudomonadales bacterium]
MPMEHLDVLIVGAGISGIGAAWHLQHRCPTKSWAILEGRGDIGGTWDLFRYPGIRSDSDMYTLGYSFKPWTDAKAIADAPAIMSYLRETAREHDIDRKIRFRQFVTAASWSSEDARWTVTVERRDADGQAEGTLQLTCGFLFMCTGYYNYAHGYEPEFPGSERFGGRIVHPQKWSDDVDYAGKRVVVIGSGATAVTLVPAMADEAAHVTMLQRSPTYVVARPAEDGVANWLRAHLPAKLAYGLTRWKNVLFGQYFYGKARKAPAQVKAFILDQIRPLLGDEYVAKHFTPSYDPWDQRLCLVPDADLFEAIRAEKASVVTDEIETFTETGIRLKSGEHLDADLIVTATGLEMQFLSDMAVTVDGEPVDLSSTLTYKGMMMSGVPNLAWSMGYTNASWTLKCDLTCGYVCRMLAHMDRTGQPIATPRLSESVEEEPIMTLTSGYVQRAIDKFPKQGSEAPWKLYQNYTLDLLTLKFGRVDDGVIEFARPRPGGREQASARAAA